MSATQWIGRTIDGRYVVDRVLGEGGMGMVLRAHHQFTGATVAVKVIRPELQLSTEIQQRFLAEARAANAIGHPAIVQVLDAGKAADGSLYLAMELLEGRPLRAAMFAAPLGPEEIRRILRDLLDVLGVAHGKGFVHRDLKPDNVFLVGPAGTVKLLDFGIAKVLGGQGGHALTATGMMMGTPAYMAPEQLRDASSVDARADLWAVGVIAYELLSGQLPFRGTIDQMLVAIASQAPDPIRAYVPAATAQLEVFVTRALARDPRARFQSASEMAAAIATLDLSGLGGTRSAQPPALSAPASWVNAATSAPAASTAGPAPHATLAPATSMAPTPAAPASWAPPSAPAVRGTPRALKWTALALAIIMLTGGLVFVLRTSEDTKPEDAWSGSPPSGTTPPSSEEPDEPDEPTTDPVAARKQSCLESCNRASTCGLAPIDCVSRCTFNDAVYACTSLANNCDTAARCFLTEYCGLTQLPRGTQSCRDSLSCAATTCSNNRECECQCYAKAQPAHTLTLGRLLTCIESCGYDQTCFQNNCGAQLEQCVRT
ncbi:MAG: serine/threonine-protein kinase [Kofleriaceae bacterium]|nr:serine/threonine-protein kinase [Kofleriaceae bacterium]